MNFGEIHVGAQSPFSCIFNYLKKTSLVLNSSFFFLYSGKQLYVFFKMCNSRLFQHRALSSNSVQNVRWLQFTLNEDGCGNPFTLVMPGRNFP